MECSNCCKHHEFGNAGGVDFECAIDICLKGRKEVYEVNGADKCPCREAKSDWTEYDKYYKKAN